MRITESEPKPTAVADRIPLSLQQEFVCLFDQGDEDAQWQMGVRYHNGEDVPHDDAQAVQWFLRAAEQAYRKTVSALDKGIQKGLLHENTASRYKSRLGVRVNAMK